MKVAVKKKNNKLVYLLESMNEIDVTVIEDEETLNAKKINGLIIERENLTSPDLIPFREKYSDIRILILLPENDDIFKKACITHDIDTLLVQNDNLEPVKTFIKDKWLNVKEREKINNVIAICGTHRQVGCTQTALTFAKTIVSMNLSVAVIGLNPYNPGEISIYNTLQSFDQVYTMFENNLVTHIDLLKRSMNNIEGFYYLVGNRDLYRALEFEYGPVQDMISLVKEHFDIVLLDVGAFYDSYLAIAALSLADTHLLIGSQEYNSAKEYRRWKEQFLDKFGFKPSIHYLIVNKYIPQATLTVKQLQQEIGVPVIGHLPYIPFAQDVEISEGLIINSMDKLYSKQATNLIKAIIEEITDVKDDAGQDRKKGFLSALLSKS